MKKKKGYPEKDTSWQGVSGWYKNLVGEKGSYYHQHMVIPGVNALLASENFNSLLDLGCGQGVFARAIKQNISYVGVDLARDLLKFAQDSDKNNQHTYIHADISQDLKLEKKDFDAAVCILALQNTNTPEKVILNAAQHLRKGGRFVLVINHPCFRIPRQSSWGIDEKQNVQYRKIVSYMTAAKIPVAAHPSKGTKSPVTWSIHEPLSATSQHLYNAGFLIEKIEEWVSDKKSEGGVAARENRSRKEIPLFMAISAIKK